MKRLSLPKIPTRIPIPDMPKFKAFSKPMGKKSKQATTAEQMNSEQATTPLSKTENIAQDKPTTKRSSKFPLPSLRLGKPKLSMPKIPAPSIPKPGIPKISAPNIPMPSVPKLGIPKVSTPHIPLPSISPWSMRKKNKAEETAGAIAVRREEEAAVLQQPEPKGKLKISMPRIRLFHKRKTEETAGATAVRREEPAAIPQQPKPATAIRREEPAAIPQQPKPAAAIRREEVADIPMPLEPKGKLKISMPRIPSFHKKSAQKPIAEAGPQTTKTASSIKPSGEKTKISLKKIKMPTLSLGGGSSKTTDKRIASLTIEGANLRIVVYHKSVIESWNSVAFDPNILKMGLIVNPEGLGEVIKNAMTKIDPKKCYVICALPGLRSVSRIINVPNVSKKEMEIIVPREVKRTMTVSEDDNYFHWQVLPSTTPQTRVFVLAIPKEPISALLRALNCAGINPANVDLKPLALMRAVNQKDAIIANCESNSMELVIVSDDVPVLIRSISLGEGVVTQDYAVGRISDELGRTIITYNEINKEHPLDQNLPIYLTGAVAAGVPFALNVAALTGRTVQPLEIPIRCPENFPVAEYMVNLGLILKVI